MHFTFRSPNWIIKRLVEDSKWLGKLTTAYGRYVMAERFKVGNKGPSSYESRGSKIK